jgi:hypothetical protein
MNQRIMRFFIVGLLILAVVIMSGCGEKETTEPSPESTPTATAPGPEAEPTSTPNTSVPETEPTLTPTVEIQVAEEVPEWAEDKDLEVKVMKGSYTLTTGSTIIRGSLTYVYADTLTFPAGLMIVVGKGGATLGGTYYPEGTKLFAYDEGILTEIK